MIWIAAKPILFIDSFLIDTFDTIATENLDFIDENKRDPLESWKVQTFVGLILSDDLAKHTLSKRGKVIYTFNIK
jgi:hypothetical protein